MKKRVLIINAPSPSDLAFVPNLIRAFERHPDQRQGRYNGILFTAEGYPNPVYVWHTATQLTIHFGDQNGKE
jgi:hypothetical protein